MADKRIKFVVTSDESKAVAGFDKVEKKSADLMGTLGKLGLAFGAMELVQFGARAVKAGAQLDVLRSNFIGTTQDIELFRKATAGTVDDASLIKLSNYASELNLSLEQQALAFGLAEDAADKFGGTVEEGFNKFVLASEGSKKALKNLGVSQAEYDKAIKEILKTTGYRIEQLDLESQAEIRKQAILKASGLTLDDINKKQQDNADKIESFSTAWKNLEAAIGKLLGSPTMIKFFEATAKAVQGWAIILGGGEASKGAAEESNVEFARNAIKMSADGLEIEKRKLQSKMQEQTIIMINNGIATEEYKIAKDIATTYENQIKILNNIESWKSKILEIDKKTEPTLKLSSEALAKQAEEQKRITEEYIKRSKIVPSDLLIKGQEKGFEGDEEFFRRKLGIDKTIDGVTPIEKPQFEIEFSQAEIDAIDFADNITNSITGTLTSGFSQAWEKIFGEANSLLEQFLANVANGLANLAAQKAANAIFDFVLGLIPGGSAVSGALAVANSGFGGSGTPAPRIQSGNTTTVIKIGDATVLKLVNGVLPQAYNDSVRYREIGVTQ